jgi:Periplasmic binding protein
VLGAAVLAAVPLAAFGASEHTNADTILVGSIAGTTGAYGSTGVAMVNGAKLAVADVNAKGGVLGKKLSLESYNDQASATLSSQLYQKLVSHGAVAVLGSGDTGPATAAMAQRLKVPNIGAVDDAGLTIYPKGPSQPPFDYVWRTRSPGARARRTTRRSTARRSRSCTTRPPTGSAARPASSSPTRARPRRSSSTTRSARTGRRAPRSA